MNLIGTQRFAYSEATKPLAEGLIKSVFPITSFEWQDANELDVEHGIDLISTLPQGQPITFQVKFLTQDFKTVCIETTSVDSQGNLKLADWQSCIAQFVLVAYSHDAQTVQRWALLDNARLAIASNKNKLRWNKRANNYSCSEFKFIEFEYIKELAPETIVDCGGDWA